MSLKKIRTLCFLVETTNPQRKALFTPSAVLILQDWLCRFSRRCLSVRITTFYAVDSPYPVGLALSIESATLIGTDWYCRLIAGDEIKKRSEPINHIRDHSPPILKGKGIGLPFSFAARPCP